MKTQKSRGQSLIEFVLVFPLVVFLMMGFFDLGRIIINYTSLSNSVREATRKAIVSNELLVEASDNPTNNTLVTMVKENAYSLKQSDFVIISAAPNIVGGRFETIVINAQYRFKPLTPGIELVFGGPDGIVLEAQSKMWITPGSQ